MTSLRRLGAQAKVVGILVKQSGHSHGVDWHLCTTLSDLRCKPCYCRTSSALYHK